MSKKLVYIVGSDYLIAKMFREQGWEVTDYLKEADLVQFTGGADVSPHLYGEKNTGLSGCSEARDAREVEVYRKVLDLGIPMAGICRGAQFLNVMNGGKMYQDVTKHAIGGTHKITSWESWTGEKKIIEVTSTHHQQMRPGNGYFNVASSDLGGVKRHVVDGKIVTVDDPTDYEVLWYPDTTCFCFQPHPEYGVASCRDYYFECLNRYLNL